MEPHQRFEEQMWWTRHGWGQPKPEVRVQSTEGTAEGYCRRDLSETSYTEELENAQSYQHLKLSKCQKKICKMPNHKIDIASCKLPPVTRPSGQRAFLVSLFCSANIKPRKKTLHKLRPDINVTLRSDGKAPCTTRVEMGKEHRA